MHLLGHHLADHKPVRIALRAFFGVGHNTSQRICARLQIHHHCKVEQLTEPQITALSAYLSSTSTAAAAIQTPLVAPPLPPKCMKYEPPSSPAATKAADPLDTLKIETDLKKQVSADIAHLKAIGTYRGRRLTAGLPSRGQRTKTNARTARKLNDKRRYTTMASPSASVSSSIPPFSSRPFASSNVLAALRALQL